MELSVFVKYYSDENFESQLSIDEIFLVKVWALIDTNDHNYKYFQVGHLRALCAE